EVDCHDAAPHVHRIVVADRDHGDVDVVEFGEELHVVGQRRIPGVVYLPSTDTDNHPRSNTHVPTVRVCRPMVRDREGNPAEVDVSASIDAKVEDILEPLLLQEVCNFERRNYLRP